MTNEELATTCKMIARSWVKDQLKRQGVKVSCIKSEDISKASAQFLWQRLGSILKTAKKRR